MLMDFGATLLRQLPAETAHRATLRLVGMAAPFLPRAAPDDSRLGVDTLGLHFPNPIGLAAGFDKNGEVPDAMAKFGFGFVECGTVTPRPQEGNPRPRLFRLTEDGAVVNRMGFNNGGMDKMRMRLSGRTRRGIVGINIGANKDSENRIDDYRRCFDVLSPLASYVTVNVSSPNTPGLRGLQNKDELTLLLSTLTGARAKTASRVPLLLKIAPDVSPETLDDIVAVTLASGIEGLIATNTTIARPKLNSVRALESGGLSGKPLLAPSTAILRAIRERTGDRLVLVGVGGVSSGADAYAKIRSGASLVQLYTALAYNGPSLVTRIKRELLECLTRDGFANVAAAVGADLRPRQA
jgi:dihydroorotate dehydrogenase